MVFSKIQQTIIVIVLLAAIFFSATGQMEKLASALGAESFAAENKKYLEASFDKSLKGFLILSGIKSGLAVVEGSEIGVGFNLEIGDAVQSVYDYVDIAWRTALTGGTIILITQLILQVVALLNHWCLSFLFFLILCLYLFTIFSQKERPIVSLLKNTLIFTSVATTALYLILPLSIRGAAFLSDKITNPLIQEAQKGFLSVKNDLTAETLSKRFFFPENNNSDASWLAKLNLNLHFDKAKESLIELGLYLKSKTEDIAIWTIKLIAGYLFDCLLFPIVFFSLLYLFVKFTVHTLLEMKFVGTSSPVLKKPDKQV